MCFQAKDVIATHLRTCAAHHALDDIIMSIDGINETNSSSRSLEVVSLRFASCREIYPCMISRPEPHRKRETRHRVDAYIARFIQDLKDMARTVEDMFLDAPERAVVRQQKGHGGYFCCDLCIANPVSIPSGNGTSSKFTTYFPSIA